MSSSGGAVHYNMNEFQRACVATCLRVLREKGFSDCRFREVTGKTERYFVASVSVAERHYEIYVYDDEAGLAIDKQWFPCERPDFRSSKDLIQAFSRMLSDKLVV